VSRQELAKPSTITVGQAKDFSVFMLRAVLSVRGDEIVDLETVNVFR
jgi:pyruvate dehydrogenase (quinone)